MKLTITQIEDKDFWPIAENVEDVLSADCFPLFTDLAIEFYATNPVMGKKYRMELSLPTGEFSAGDFIVNDDRDTSYCASNKTGLYWAYNYVNGIFESQDK